MTYFLLGLFVGMIVSYWFTLRTIYRIMDRAVGISVLDMLEKVAATHTCNTLKTPYGETTYDPD